MSIIDKFFNGGSARKNVPFGYDKRIVMPNRHRIQYRFMKCTITDCFLQELTRLR